MCESRDFRLPYLTGVDRPCQQASYPRLLANIREWLLVRRRDLGRRQRVRGKPVLICGPIDLRDVSMCWRWLLDRVRSGAVSDSISLAFLRVPLCERMSLRHWCIGEDVRVFTAFGVR
jgi:hypothetical protein